MAIANPEGFCVGACAVESFGNVFTPEEREALKANIITSTGSFEQTATAISLRLADAVIGWRVFEYWEPERIETITLPKEIIPRVGYIPIAVASVTRQPELARQFIDFVTGPEGAAISANCTYFATPEDAFSWIGVIKPVEGEYVVPADWLDLRQTVNPKDVVKAQQIN